MQFEFRSFDFLPEAESTFTLLNTYPWFPQYGYLKRYTFDLKIKVPKPHIAIASGTTMKRWEEKEYNCLHSQEEIPVLLASVLFGKYHTIKDDSKRPVIYVHSLFKQQRQAEPILSESRTIVDLYEEKIGPFPYDELDIAQMGFFYGFGQAPPGLVQLTGEAFLVAEQVSIVRGAARTLFSASDDGTLVFMSGPDALGSDLVRFDGEGRPAGTIGDRAIYQELALSPNGRSLAVSISDPVTDNDGRRLPFGGEPKYPAYPAIIRPVSRLHDKTITKGL